MVGLSIVLEGQNKNNSNNNYVKSTPIKYSKTTPPLLVINKTNNINTKPSSSSSSYNYYCYNSPSPLPAINFLDNCYLCRQPLLPGKDIYMYRGDRAFCSEECRCRHICMDDEESVRREKCSMVAMMKTPASSSSSSSASSRPSHRKAATTTTTTKSTRAGGFAY